MLRYVELLLDDDAATGVTAVSIVDEPAVQRNFVLLRQQRLYRGHNNASYYTFDSESRTLYGVLMLANVPILRIDEEGEPYYVFFRPETIRQMMVRASKYGYLNNVNLMHRATQKVSDVYYIGGYQVDVRRGLVPHFEQKKITDGSWIGIYHVDNEQILEMIKDNKFRGFSIEGNFVQRPVGLL